MGINKQKKVFVGLSGGVDSSVSATLLKKAGYDVTGVFIKVWTPNWFPCTWREDRRDAMRVCAKLDIPFLTLDLESEYKREVVDYMLAEYKAGRTPNPDVMCNKHIKFGAFYKWAREQGADYIATGHYSQIKKTPDGYKLISGKDSNKDQVYFLWTLGQKQLPHVVFPVGHLKKPQVRKLAEKFNLPTATKKDSQGLCFIGKVNMKEFLKHYIPTKQGKVLDTEGNIIGTHDGAIFHTIGERHGFMITKKTPNDDAYYVISKNLKNNTIIVSNKVLRKDKNTVDNIATTKEVALKNLNWIFETPKSDKKYTCQIRYRQDPQECYVKTNHIVFKNLQSAVSPGQSLVLYLGDTCLGGGIIESILK